MEGQGTRSEALSYCPRVHIGVSKSLGYPSELSGGQQQRVAIARSLAMNPDVVLSGEVTAALHPKTMKEVLVTVEHGPPATFFTEASDPRTREFLSQIL